MKKRNKKIVNSKINNIFSNQEGMALLATLIFVFVLVTFGVALLTMTSNDSKLSTLQRESTRAFYLAETGIEKAIWYLNSSEDNPDGLDFMGPLDGGTTAESYNVVFSYDSGPPEIKTLVSTGKVVGGGEYNKGTRKIEVKLIKGVSPTASLTYDHAIFTNSNMTLNGESLNFVGDIHSNGNLTINANSLNIVGDATVTGETNKPEFTDPSPSLLFPHIDWDYFLRKAESEINGGYYYDEDPSTYGETTKVFNVSETLTGIHYIDGNVVIQSDINLQNATIVANGTIRVLGNGNVTLLNEIKDHPLALIAKGDITIGGSVHGEGIIQTEGNFVNNGTVEINEGAIYAELGTFNGGGAVEFNVCYATDLAGIQVPGTGFPIYKKISWQEVY